MNLLLLREKRRREEEEGRVLDNRPFIWCPDHSVKIYVNNLAVLDPYFKRRPVKTSFRHDVSIKTENDYESEILSADIHVSFKMT